MRKRTTRTLEKKLEEYLKSFKKIKKTFKEIGNNFLNKFSTHCDKNFGLILRKWEKIVGKIQYTRILIKKYVVAIYKRTWKLCRTLKLCQMVAVCFSFISYTFQHQSSSLHTVVSIRANGVRDIRSVFHYLFFSCVNMTDFEQCAVIKLLSKWNTTNVEIENELLKVMNCAKVDKKISWR